MIVARPFVPYQAAIRNGCSARRYHAPVTMAKRGRQPASNIPSTARAAKSPPKLFAADVQACTMPQPNNITDNKSRGETLTIKNDKNGSDASCETRAIVTTQ